MYLTVFNSDDERHVYEIPTQELSTFVTDLIEEMYGLATEHHTPILKWAATAKPGDILLINDVTLILADALPVVTRINRVVSKVVTYEAKTFSEVSVLGANTEEEEEDYDDEDDDDEEEETDEDDEPLPTKPSPKPGKKER